MRDNVDETVGFYIKKYRQDKKLTQEQLGKLLNVSQAMITQYEKGTRHPKIETLRKIAQVLGVSLSDFLDVGQTFIDDSEEGVTDCLVKDLEGNTSRKIGIGVSSNTIPPIPSELVDTVQKLKLLNHIGQSKAHDYISDLVEQEKYLKSKPSTSE